MRKLSSWLIVGLLLLTPSLGPALAESLQLFTTEIESSETLSGRHRRVGKCADGHLPFQRDAMVRQYKKRRICLPEGG